MKVSRLVYKDKYAGIKVVGSNKVEPPEGEYRAWHMHRAFYITSELESSLWGTVQSYDGAGMSGGPFHWIALYPKNMVQGPLFKLLRRLEITPKAPVQPLWDEFAKKGMYVSTDGKLRYLKTGQIVSGSTIRELFTGPGGKVPESGPARQEAEKWAILFHKLLAHPSTYLAQAEFAIEYLIKSQEKIELETYRKFLDVQTPERIGSTPELQLPPAVDLAMCFYHASSVNAPAIAKKCLMAVKTKDPYAFSKQLIKKLGTYKYGRWADVPGEKGSRYDWTRKACIESGFWSKALLDDLMPRDF